MRKFYWLFILCTALTFGFVRSAFALSRLVEVLAVGVTDNNAVALQSGTVTVYDAGTTTLRTVYTDFGLTSAAANPLTLDTAGRAVVYSNKRIKLLIKDSNGATIRTIDNVGTADSDLSSASAATLAGSGLTAPGDGTIAVNPDGQTLDIAAGKVEIKPGGTASNTGELLNASLSASVATNALTISLLDKSGSTPTTTSKVTIGFRSSTATSGVYNTRQVSAATTLVISSGSTLGHLSATTEYIYVYALDNAGTVELAASSTFYDDGTVLSTTAEGGAGAARSASVVYSTTARSSVPIRILGRLKSSQTTAGTWASAISEISMFPFSLVRTHELAVTKPTGASVTRGGYAISTSNSGTFSTSSSSFVDVTNLTVTITTTGRPVKVYLVSDASGGLFSHIGIQGPSDSSSSAGGYFQLQDGGVEVKTEELVYGKGFGTSYLLFWIPVGSLSFEYTPAAGTHVYKIQAKMGSNSTVQVYNAKLVAREIY